MIAKVRIERHDFGLSKIFVDDRQLPAVRSWNVGSEGPSSVEVLNVTINAGDLEVIDLRGTPDSDTFQPLGAKK